MLCWIILEARYWGESGNDLGFFLTNRRSNNSSLGQHGHEELLWIFITRQENLQSVRQGLKTQLPFLGVDVGRVPGSSLREGIATCLMLPFPAAVSGSLSVSPLCEPLWRGQSASRHCPTCLLCPQGQSWALFPSQTPSVCCCDGWWACCNPTVPNKDRIPVSPFSAGCLGNANVFLITRSVLPCEFLLGFIAVGLQTISSQLALALPSCLITAVSEDRKSWCLADFTFSTKN